MKEFLPETLCHWFRYSFSVLECGTSGLSSAYNIFSQSARGTHACCRKAERPRSTGVLCRHSSNPADRNDTSKVAPCEVPEVWNRCKACPLGDISKSFSPTTDSTPCSPTLPRGALLSDTSCRFPPESYLSSLSTSFRRTITKQTSTAEHHHNGSSYRCPRWCHWPSWSAYDQRPHRS